MKVAKMGFAKSGIRVSYEVLQGFQQPNLSNQAFPMSYQGASQVEQM